MTQMMHVMISIPQQKVVSLKMLKQISPPCKKMKMISFAHLSTTEKIGSQQI